MAPVLAFLSGCNITKTVAPGHDLGTPGTAMPGNCRDSGACSVYHARLLAKPHERIGSHGGDEAVLEERRLAERQVPYGT
jgi:hypothetical protein